MMWITMFAGAVAVAATIVAAIGVARRKATGLGAVSVRWIEQHRIDVS